MMKVYCARMQKYKAIYICMYRMRLFRKLQKYTQTHTRKFSSVSRLFPLNHTKHFHTNGSQNQLYDTFVKPFHVNVVQWTGKCDTTMHTLYTVYSANSFALCSLLLDRALLVANQFYPLTLFLGSIIIYSTRYKDIPW